MTDHPIRHADTGAPCRHPLCAQAWPTVHHQPRHCREVVAGASTTGVDGRRRKTPVELAQQALDMAGSLR